MPDSRRHGEVFDEIAEAYDARRSGYPREIVAVAVGLAGLGPGSRVVEIGAGTGKLTEELVACGLRVDAVEPGRNMIEIARGRVQESELAHFHVGRFEDVPLPEERFDAVFAAAAFHWVDPAVGWPKAAALLRPGGTIALLQPIGVRDAGNEEIQNELRAAFARFAPDQTATRPALRDEATIRTGAEERRENVSDVWAWLAHPGLAFPEAATLFGPAVLTTVPRVRIQTADQSWAIFETTSGYHRLAARARTELRAECARIIGHHGGTLRSTQVVALVTARKR